MIFMSEKQEPTLDELVTELREECWRHVRNQKTPKERQPGSFSHHMQAQSSTVFQKMIDERIEQIKEAAPDRLQMGTGKERTTMRKMKIYIAGPMTGIPKI